MCRSSEVSTRARRLDSVRLSQRAENLLHTLFFRGFASQPAVTPSTLRSEPGRTGSLFTRKRWWKLTERLVQPKISHSHLVNGVITHLHRPPFNGFQTGCLERAVRLCANAPVRAHHTGLKTSGTFYHKMGENEIIGFFGFDITPLEFEASASFFSFVFSLDLRYSTLSICIRECNYSNVKKDCVYSTAVRLKMTLKQFLQPLTCCVTRGWLVCCFRNRLCIWERLGRFDLYIIWLFKAKFLELICL